MRKAVILPALSFVVLATCYAMSAQQRVTDVAIPQRPRLEPAVPKLIPVIGAGEPFHDRDPRLAWKGTSIKVNPDAIGDELALQERIADAINIADANNDVRRGRFRWCLGQDNLKLVGWWGVINAVTPDPQGGVLVMVRVSPKLVSTWGKVTTTGDHLWEEYLFDGDNVVYLRSVEADKALVGSIQVF